MALTIQGFDQSSQGISTLLTSTSPDTSQNGSVLSAYYDTTDSSLRASVSQQLERGATVDLSGGSVTLENPETDQTLRIDPEDSAVVYEQGEQAAIIQNRTTGEVLTLEEGSTLEVSGEGQVEFLGNETTTGDLFGEFERVRLEDGERAEIRRTTEGLQFDEVNFSEEAIVGGSPTDLTVSGDTGDALALSGDEGEEISFSSGDDAVLFREGGQLVFENRTTDTRLRVDSGEELSVSGDAEARVGTDGIEFEEGDRLEATVGSTQATLTNRTTTETVPVAEGETNTSPLEARFGLFSDPRSEQIRLFGTVLTRLI